ncbi:MAG TPA: lysozyme inhibitor LprI family protein [Blastocatellia bacterium]|nr:lysozyme inhibitor LprI family protein [Blastocatellia bacterium]
MKLRPAILILTVILLTTAAASRPQTDLMANACRQYREADAEMNRVYQQILKAYGKDTLFIGKLKLAQRAWLRFRAAHLDALYPQSDKRSAYGSFNGDCQCLARAELTLKRTDELRRWLKGTEEGDVCAGSVQIKK